MSEQANDAHAFRHWVERRLDELESTLSSLETEATQLKAELRAEADHAIDALKHERDSLRAMLHELRAEAVDATALRRAQFEDALQQLKEVAEAADAHMDRLADAGRESWTALGAALTESRKAFDAAAQKAWDALKAATSGKS